MNDSVLDFKEKCCKNCTHYIPYGNDNKCTYRYICRRVWQIANEGKEKEKSDD